MMRVTLLACLFLLLLPCLLMLFHACYTRDAAVLLRLSLLLLHLFKIHVYPQYCGKHHWRCAAQVSPAKHSWTVRHLELCEMPGVHVADLSSGASGVNW